MVDRALRTIVLLGVLLISCLQLRAQINVSGTVIDANSKRPLSFVNIGIRHKNIGTVAADSGTFSIDIPRQHTADTLTFSVVGYEPLDVALSTDKARQKLFALKTATMPLKEFAVATQRLTKKTYGLKRYKPLLHFLDGSVDQRDIFEIAQLIDLGSSRSKILDLNLHINESKNDSAAFRINFYSYDGNRPADKLVDRSIVQTHAIKEGWLTFDVSSYNVWLKGKVVVAIEFIPSHKNSKVVYEIKPGGRVKSFVRSSSLGLWQVPPHQYRMYVTALGSNKEQEAEEKEITPSFTLFSKEVNDSFSIFVRLPDGYAHATHTTYPLIYLLDANVYFGYLADSIGKTKGIQPILIGIGYKDFARMDSLRNRDYTYPDALSSDSFVVSGGGAKFYDFLSVELIPLIDKKYRTDKDKRTLMGHSLGGYFTLFALYKDLSERKATFSNYIAASPSVEYHHQYLLTQFRTLHAAAEQKNVFIAWGALEDIGLEEVVNYSHMVNACIKVIADIKNTQLQKKLYPQADHMETALPAFYQGLAPAMMFDGQSSQR